MLEVPRTTYTNGLHHGYAEKVRRGPFRNTVLGRGHTIEVTRAVCNGTFGLVGRG